MKWTPRIIVDQGMFSMPQVLKLAAEMNLLPVQAAGALFRFWIHAQQHADWSGLLKVSGSELDALVGCVGFREKLQAAELLKHEGADKYTVEFFHDHVSVAAAKKAKDALRNAAHRAAEAGRKADEQRTNSGESKDGAKKNRGKPPKQPLLIPDEPAVIVFPCNGDQSEWPLVQSQIDKWAALYQGVDILGEMKKALAWVEANGRKTARGMPRFCVAWLAKANDRGPQRPKYNTPSGPVRPPSTAELLAEIQAKRKADMEARR